jgi:alanine racemase
MTFEARLTVDLDALAANYGRLLQAASGAEVAPVVKADAYGLGAAAVARRLWTEGARRFFVARLAEGEALRSALGAGRAAAVYVLDGCPEGAADRLRAADLTPVLNSWEQAGRWAASGGGPAALHIDTGMNRLGLKAEDLTALPPLDLRLVMSHLACAEDAGHPLNARQRARFEAAAAAFPDVPRSLANSAGVFLGDAFRLDMVRPGIALYGGAADAGFETVVTLEAPVLQVRQVQPGETVGYGAAFAAAQPTTVAIVAAGYADGVLRAGAGGGYGWTDGVPCPLLGRISMDLIALDIGRAPAAGPGTMIELLGANVALGGVAERAGTIPYEVLTRIGGARVRRVYRGETA